MAEITRVNTEAEYDAASARTDALIHSAPGSAEDEELNRVSDLIVEYEDRHYPMDDGPKPHAMLEFMLDQQMVTREALLALAGDDDVLDDIMKGRGALTPALAQVLHERFGTPVEALLKTP